MPADLIFVVQVGTQEFTNPNQLENFIKYLFSCSKNHCENAQTKNNFCFQQDLNTQKLNRYSFVLDAQEKYNKFIRKFESHLEEELHNDMYYVGFFITIGSKTFSNFFTLKDDTLTADLPEETIRLIIEDYFSSEEEPFYEAMNEMIEETIAQYTNFSDASEKERLIIELKIHQEIKNKTLGDNVLLAISHHDQDSQYHIHRLLIS